MKSIPWNKPEKSTETDFFLPCRFRVNRQRVKISRLAETLGHQLDAFGVLASRCGWLVQVGISKGLRGVLLRQVKGEQRRRDREVGRGREGDKARERETEIKREAPSFSASSVSVV